MKLKAFLGGAMFGRHLKKTLCPYVERQAASQSAVFMKNLEKCFDLDLAVKISAGTNLASSKH